MRTGLYLTNIFYILYCSLYHLYKRVGVLQYNSIDFNHIVRKPAPVLQPPSQQIALHSLRK